MIGSWRLFRRPDRDRVGRFFGLDPDWSVDSGRFWKFPENWRSASGKCSLIDFIFHAYYMKHMSHRGWIIPRHTGGSSSVESSFWLVGSGSVISFSKSFVTLSDDRGSDRFLERFSFRFDGGWIPFPDDLKNMISFLKKLKLTLIREFLGPSPSAFSGNI